MKMYPFNATALDDGMGPVTWTLYESQPAPVDITEDFVEVDEIE
jgi:hypothetical protein